MARPTTSPSRTARSNLSPAGLLSRVGLARESGDRSGLGAWVFGVGIFAAAFLGAGVVAAQEPGAASVFEPPTPRSVEVFGEAVPRVLMVGDSWAEFMWKGQSLRETFAANGRPDILEEGAATALSGTTAAQWTSAGMLQLISDELAAHPTIDTVQLTLGGNDFLAGQSGGGWWTGMSMVDEEALIDQIIADAATVIDFILGLDGELEIIVSLYDYTNFDESLSGALGFTCDPRWDDLGQPTALEINSAFVRVQDRVDTLVASRERVYGVRHGGLMQFVFGFPDDGIPPGDLLPPGDLSLPSPIEAMWLLSDCIHLGGDGYLAVAQNLWNNYYDRRFNGTLMRDGFESGDTAAWSASVP